MIRLLGAIAAAALATAMGRRDQLRRQTGRKSVMDTFTMTPRNQPQTPQNEPKRDCDEGDKPSES